MSKFLVYFQEKRDMHIEWEYIQGVTLVVEASNHDELADKIDQQLSDAADYQLYEHRIEARYRASWTLDNGNTRVHELVPASMWG